jgi:hypothetical protein
MKSLAERYVLAHITDEAIDWEASGITAQDYIMRADTATHRLKAKEGQTITEFWFRPLTDDEITGMEARYAPVIENTVTEDKDGNKTQRTSTTAGGDDPINLEAFRLAVVEVSDFWKATEAEPHIPADKAALIVRGIRVSIGNRIRHLQALTIDEALFEDGDQ